MRTELDLSADLGQEFIERAVFREEPGHPSLERDSHSFLVLTIAEQDQRDGRVERGKLLREVQRGDRPRTDITEGEVDSSEPGNLESTL